MAGMSRQEVQREIERVRNQTTQEWLAEYSQPRGEDSMKWTDNGGGSDFEPAPAGTHSAICFQLIDLGTQYNAMYENHQHQVFIGFELPEEIRTWEDDEGEHSAPYTAGKFYTMSLNEKANLRKHMESWRGKTFTEQELAGFDPKNILGVPAILSIVHKERQGKKPRADIGSISKPMKGMTAPELHHEKLYFSLENFDQAVFDKVPKGFQDMIRKSEEWKTIGNAPDEPQESENPADFVDDDIPF